MTKILVVDDELLSRKKIKRFIDQRPETFEVLEASNGIEALNMIESQSPDIVFLDIEMPEMNGMDLVQSIGKPQFKLIFQTAYSEFAVEAFEKNALDYILKPVEENRFDESLKKVIQKIETKREDFKLGEPEEQLGAHDQVFVKDGDKCWFVELGDIRLFESEGNYVRVYFENNKPLILKSLNNLDKKLSDKIFLEQTVNISSI